jgi:hypothetical protein
MDNNDNDERIMEEIIVGGANAFASYTDEEIILNVIGQGGVAANDFANNEEDIAADSENNDDLEDANAEGSNEVYISCIKFISTNLVTPFLVYSHKFMSIHVKLLLILVGFRIDDEKVQERLCTTNHRRCDVSYYHRGVRAWPACCSKKVKDKFVSQCGAIVRDNVPIKYREWKGKPSNPYVVPDAVKDQLWNDVLKHFALPEGVDPNLVKGWTLVKIATQFQNFKKLTRDFIKNIRTPNWDEYPKIKDHWKSFVEYKKSETFAQKSAQAKNNASKKGEYNHRLGRGGYAVAIPMWRKMEQDLIAKGIISAVFH